jgi:pimeloyl-ACP methyl ester carboxylesterase
MDPFDPKRLILIHGLEGSSQGDKAVLLRSLFTEMMTPDFRGSLEERMKLLYVLLGEQTGWTIIGSSLGGLMAALFAIQQPHQVRQLVLLAPALFIAEFTSGAYHPVDVRTVVYHGRQDKVVPIGPTRQIAENIFRNLVFNEVDDDHRLFQTVHSLDWKALLND